jgi:hypothetical protein
MAFPVQCIGSHRVQLLSERTYGRHAVEQRVAAARRNRTNSFSGKAPSAGDLTLAFWGYIFNLDLKPKQIGDRRPDVGFQVDNSCRLSRRA